MFYHQNIIYTSLLQENDPTGESIYDPLTNPFKVWIPQQKYIVLGRSQKIELECNLPQIHKHKIPVIQRKSGGGAVLLSPQVICITLRFSRSLHQGILNYLQKGSEKMQLFLKSEFHLITTQKGSGDLCFNNLKILGCSLRINKDYGFYLGSLIVDNIISDVEKFLTTPTKIPLYRKNRPHQKFISSLNTHLKKNISTIELQQKLHSFFVAFHND